MADGDIGWHTFFNKDTFYLLWDFLVEIGIIDVIVGIIILVVVVALVFIPGYILYYLYQTKQDMKHKEAMFMQELYNRQNR